MRIQRARMLWAVSGLRGSKRRLAELPAQFRAKGLEDDIIWRRRVLSAQRLEYRTLLRRLIKIRIAVRTLDEAARPQAWPSDGPWEETT